LETEVLLVPLAQLATQVSEVLVVEEVTTVHEVQKDLLVMPVLMVFQDDQVKMVRQDPTVLCRVISLSDTVKKELSQSAPKVPANYGTVTPCSTPKATNLSTLKISAELVLVCDNSVPCHSCSAA
jgi:hypothetical protein